MKPEEKVKKAVKELLKQYKVWWFMPIGGPYSMAGVPDFVCCIKGLIFTIETKAPGKKPTALQDKRMADIRLAGGKTFVIDGDLSELKDWIECL
jgi:hypothetical protein